MSNSKREWTENQKKAIDARGMQVLVSAAAGSGKTAVLTERVNNILCDVNNPCSVSEILVVTFTRAAATEMRERIYKSLSETCEKNKDNSDYLRKQMTLLPTADICTIDSFCSKIVRENFHLANVGADFTFLDEKDDTQLMNEITDAVINELYEDNNSKFRELTSMFLSERDDSLLCEIVKKLYNYSRAYPSPFKWLDEVAKKFSPEKTPDESGLTSIIYKYIYMFSDYHISRLNKCISIMEESGGFSTDYFKRFNLTIENLSNLKLFSEKKDWDALVETINNGIVVKPYARNLKVDEIVKKTTQEVFEDVEADVKALLKHTLPLTSEHKEDTVKLYPLIKILCDCVKRVTTLADERKKELNAYNFDDILHKCIDLLIIPDTGDKTQLAYELSSKYKEILIDEYQDTNEAQDKIFETISKNKQNLYVVGDVKQSIYRFRLASPELFMSLKNSLTDFNGEIKPSQIILEKNFRSRKGVTEAVNYIFKRIMSNDVGEINYDTREYLHFGASYFNEKSTPDIELICVDQNYSDEEEYVTEPNAIAQYIKRVFNSGVEVNDNGNLRKINYGDFSILLRSMKKAHLYAEELKNAGIPVSYGLDGNASAYKEIQFLISLFKVISNPLMDVPLTAVLFSPVFGFSPDDLSEIRLIDRKADLYKCLVKSAENSMKARFFLKKLELYRNISTVYSIDEFVKFIVRDTAVSDIYYVSGEGERRIANINGLIKLSEDYTSTGRTGLSGFIRYLDNAVENDGLKSVDGGFSNKNSVKIMSIHKSKGLEFPYVIIGECSKGFNRRDSYDSLTIARETGIGLKIRDDNLFTSYHTLSSVATEKAILFGDISEELRVLYVAMTRAKEHLAFVTDISSKALKKRVKLNAMLSTDKDGDLHPYAVFKASSYSEWILSCLASHRDCAVIRDACSLSPEAFKNDISFGIDTSYITSKSDYTNYETSEEKAEIDFELLEKIRKNINYEYPYEFSGVLAKRTASSTEDNKSQKSYHFNAKPSFLSCALSGAERGTAIHKFLELCDFRNAAEGLDNEILSLLNTGRLSKQEVDVIDKNAIKSFLESEIGKRLINSEKIYKEYEFSVLKAASDLYNNLPEYAADEQIVVQGKLDCAFLEDGEIVLLDYKTDNIVNEALFVDLYKNQLRIYKDAFEECTDLKVKEMYIYSFKLKKFILIK